ncbi:uncharacterized protein BT62DRAFT_934552 [Guyanagaster necrorhizus]|uniref:DUF6534 domain-containing protein n=1 Tax=Guyanagaster necrorhizus TaxID=856835 RepID=A0A9P7VMK4_9AGAR|nr:uncharacterized protein BT62DRAFT_934552 [Guyanagaster necrorhizus MCA 3950]KAG7443968.1 hypothetical protein BT62DRAFT_934552 [Guyanagaster necrorhizus MCA 3950]
MPPGSASTLLGLWFVGLFLDLYLQGILSAQTDKLTVRASVGFLALITTLESIQRELTWRKSAIVWVQLVEDFADIQSAGQSLVTAWYEVGNPLMVALISFYVQCYYCYRLWIISERWWIVLPIMLVCIFAIIAAILTVSTRVYQKNSAILFLRAWTHSIEVADVFLAATTAFFLLKTRRNVLAQTKGMINALVRLTFQTATPAVIYVLLTMICVYLPMGKPRALPKLYAISMMWTLNARKDIRVFYYDSSTSRTHSRSQRPTLTGRYSIQVLTRTEVLQMSDADTHTEATARKSEEEASIQKKQIE